MRLEPIANPSVLSVLPDVAPEYARSYLTTLNGEVLYTFLYNPETLKFSKTARYTEVPVGGTAIQPQYYGNTSGSKLSLDDLLFDTHCAEKSSRELIEGLGRLTLPKPETLKPDTINFVFGSFTFGPAVITDLNWEVTGFVNGEAAIGRISLTLIEKPGGNLPSAYSTRQIQNAQPSAIAASGESTTTASTSTGSTATATPTPPTLTTRQQEDVKKQTLAYIGANLNRFPVDVRDAYRAGRLRILTPSANEINMAGDSKTLGRFGAYNLTTQKLEPLPQFQ